MTFNDLEQIFVDGCYRSILTNREDLPEKAHRRAGLKAAVEALEGEVERWRNNSDIADVQIADLKARAERLREALEPFARMGTERQPCDPAEGTMRMRVVTVPEIETARKALEDDKPIHAAAGGEG